MMLEIICLSKSGPPSARRALSFLTEQPSNIRKAAPPEEEGEAGPTGQASPSLWERKMRNKTVSPFKAPQGFEGICGCELMPFSRVIDKSPLASASAVN